MAAFVRRYGCRSYTFAPVHARAKAYRFVDRVVVVSQETLPLYNLNIGDAVVPKHLLCHLTARQPRAQPHLTVVLKLALQPAADKSADERQDAGYDHIAIVCSHSRFALLNGKY